MTFDQNGYATGQLASLPTYSWPGNAYTTDSSLIQTAALGIDFADASLWPWWHANDSLNGTAVQQCCTPSLAWVFGVPTSDSTKPSKPDVVKHFPLSDMSCSKTPSQIISDMESNFGSFANYNDNFGMLGIPYASATVTFTGTISTGATISIHNVNVDRITGGRVKTRTFDVAVTVKETTPTSFSFATLPGHVLYPATISFAASSSGAGRLSFAIDVNGYFANSDAERGYYGGGSNLEDHIWKHVLSQVQSDCK